MDQSGESLSRWKLARLNTPPVESRKELLSGFIGGLVAAAVLWRFSDSTPVIQQLLIVVASALLFAVFIPCIQFGWNYLQVPRRLQAEAIRDIQVTLAGLDRKLSTLSANQEPQTPRPAIAPRVSVLNCIRLGEQLQSRVVRTGVSARAEVEVWIDKTGRLLAEHVSTDAAEQFVAAAKGNAELRVQLAKRLTVLAEVAKNL